MARCYGSVTGADLSQSNIINMRDAHFLSICELLQAFKGLISLQKGVGRRWHHGACSRCKFGSSMQNGRAGVSARWPANSAVEPPNFADMAAAHGCAMLWCHGANTPRTPPDPSSAGATVDSLQTILTHTFKSLAILGSVGIPTSSSNRGLILFLTTPT